LLIEPHPLEDTINPEAASEDCDTKISKIEAGVEVCIPTLPPSVIVTLVLPDVLSWIPLKPCISTSDDPLLIK
jgi:hypothetical protein